MFGLAWRKIFNACLPLLLFSCVWTLSGCGKAETPARRDGKLAVAVSIIPQIQLVERLGGDLVDVVSVVQPGESPETFQPSDAAVTTVMQSAVFFRIGLPFERGAWFKALKNSPVKVVDTRMGIKLRPIEAHHHDDEAGHDDHAHAGHDHDHDHAHDAHHEHDDELDPHIWVAPTLLMQQARTIAAALCELEPQHAATYQANLEKLLADLTALDAELKALLAPVRGKTFFVFHPAWGYLADAYGLTQQPIERSGKNPSDAELTKLQQLAGTLQVRTIFVQPQNAGPGARAVAQTIGAQVKSLDPLAADVLTNLRQVGQSLAEALKDQP